MITTTQRYRRWPDDDELGGCVYEPLTDAQASALAIHELREAICDSGTLMRDVATGQLFVFDSCAMVPAEGLPATDQEEALIEGVLEAEAATRTPESWSMEF